MATQSTQTSAKPAVVYLPYAPQTAAPFHGELHANVEDWLNQYDRVARYNNWTLVQRLQYVCLALEWTAKRWFENHDAVFISWDVCKIELQRTFAPQHRRERAEHLLRTRTQGHNESVTSFVEDLRVSARADSLATDDKKLRVHMRGVRHDIFVGLVRNPPATVEVFATDAMNMERALKARASHYQQLPGVAA